ncbi:MAG: 30S ribosomal protein S9 [Candidatus Peribacteria bacterium]|nr:MAG: 30S ribosomal protein S9 [Candidatus Peribacteria bacterium]
MATARKYNYAVGRRKMSTAVIKLYPQGKGNFVIKKGEEELTLKEFFGGHDYLIENALMPFAVLGSGAEKSFDGEIRLSGGGLAGQAQALRLAFARALVGNNDSNRPTLKPHGLLKRDPRIKERKKPGLKKARKSPQWSKR